MFSVDARADVRQTVDAKGFCVQASIFGLERGYDFNSIVGTTVRQMSPIA